MKTKLIGFIICSAFYLTSCMTRAPSDYELDKQAGRLPKNDLTKKENLPDEVVYKVVGLNKDSKEPIRIEPRTEKVWIYDQETDSGHYLQGTYIYFQVESGHWLNPGDTTQ